jgi:peptidyl-Lys metalloendopeptidase
MTLRRSAALSFLALAALTVACSEAPQAPVAPEAEVTGISEALRESRDLEIRLSVPDQALEGAGPVLVRIEATNVSTRSVSVPRWFLQDGELEEALFEVTRDGRSLPYEGMHVKRPAPTAEDFLTLAPGGTMHVTVDLQTGFDLSRDGVYGIAYRGQTGIGPTARLVRSAVQPLLLAGRLPKAVEVGEVTPMAGTLTFAGRCSSTQQTEIRASITNATTYATESDGYLAAIVSGTNRYTAWFGTFSTAAQTQMKGQFANIRNAFETKPITVDCGCKKTAYAYVYPGQPYKIWVCKAFWTAPALGTDSKAGTMIHEMSHFTIVAGTNDYVYGQAAALNLAATNPTNARKNADNHEYFAENTPFKN